MFDKLMVGVMGVAFAAFVLGCGTDRDAGNPSHDHPADQAQVHSEEEAHSHAAEGPHGGHLIVLGDEQYHAELLHDEATHTVTVHLLDAAGENPVSADQPEVTLQVFQDGQFVDYTLQASASEAGASEFTLVDEALCDVLLHAEEVRGRLQVTIDGKQLTGIVEHQAHDHEGHEHEGEDEEDHDHAQGDRLERSLIACVSESSRKSKVRRSFSPARSSPTG
jgi:hypothetical protein